MIPRLSRLLILTIVLVSTSLPIVRSLSRINDDPLKPYSTCKIPGDLKIKEVTRRNVGNKYRPVYLFGRNNVETGE